MSNTESTEARELSLVGKVELKIALTQSDAALQSILKTYLPPLLLKLASEFPSVRNKVWNPDVLHVAYTTSCSRSFRAIIYRLSLMIV